MKLVIERSGRPTVATELTDEERETWNDNPPTLTWHNSAEEILDSGPSRHGAGGPAPRRRQQRHQHSPLGIGQIVTGRGRHRGHESLLQWRSCFDTHCMLWEASPRRFRHSHG
jgi:hypothetical protein